MPPRIFEALPTCGLTVSGANGDDATMAYDKRMDQLPLFVSYPRTGSHWLNCVMELYFDRPRLREERTTLFDKSRTDWMWFHDHDMDLTLKHPDVLYLYREPVSTIFSHLNYYARLPESPLFEKSPLKADEGKIAEFCDEYREHLRKWLLSSDKARTAVSYKRLRENWESEFPKVSAHFNRPFDRDRAARSFAAVTPEALASRTVNPAAIGKHLLTTSYEGDRGRFAERWQKYIRARVILPELESFFA